MNRPAPREVTPDRLAVTVPEAARMLGIGARLVWQELSANRLASARFGRRRVIPVDALRAWLAERVEGRGAP